MNFSFNQTKSLKKEDKGLLNLKDFFYFPPRNLLTYLLLVWSQTFYYKKDKSFEKRDISDGDIIIVNKKLCVIVLDIENLYCDIICKNTVGTLGTLTD